MKKLVLALTAVAAFSAPALAADLAARPSAKAPIAAAPVASWTGCYIGAGGGGAYTTNDNYSFITATGVPIGNNQTSGARGWFGTVEVGCDYQVNNFVFGAFADYDFSDIKGDLPNGVIFTGSRKQDYQWAVGGRAGYLVVPQLLTYFSAGYTQAHWKPTDYSSFGPAATPSITTSGFSKAGWFIGAGDEYALNFLPSLFWKTEYRYSEFDRADLVVTNFGTGIPLSSSQANKIREHSVRSELVYRFNWGGPAIGKY